MLFPWAANDQMERGLAIHALRMAINLGLPAQKAAFQTRSGGPVSERLKLSRSIADRLLFKVKPVFVVRHCGIGAVAVMNYDKIRNDQRY